MRGFCKDVPGQLGAQTAIGAVVGAAIGVFLLCLVASAPVMAAGGDAADSGAGKSADGGGKATSSAESRFLQLNPFILPIIDQDGIAAQYAMLLVLELRSPQLRGKMRYMMPKLRNAYYHALLKLISVRRSDGKLPPMSRIKKRLTDITRETIGEDIVDNVLIQDIAYRPMRPS